MKTIKLFITVTVLAIATIASASGWPELNVVPVTADRAIVSIKNAQAEKFEVSIENKTGELVFFKRTNTPITDYQKIYDFENLENGSYVFNIKVNDVRVSKNFEVLHSEINVGESEMRFDPYFKFSDDILKFSYLNFDEENLKLKIYQDLDLIYQSKLGNDFVISAGYDLSKLQAGNYRIKLSSFNNEFNFEIEK
jgi:hypothetical protein